MRYFSGFALQNEQELFEPYLIKNNFTYTGFSYGAIGGFEAVLNSKTRVDLLQLFSPANFMHKDKKFKKLQLLHYRRNPNLYIQSFLKNIANPSDVDMSQYLGTHDKSQLDELLNYEWSEEKLATLQKKGVQMEVYLGECDEIIDAQQNYDFFKEFATVYFIKKAGHILKLK